MGYLEIIYLKDLNFIDRISIIENVTSLGSDFNLENDASSDKFIL
jgi:hypothetical protein